MLLDNAIKRMQGQVIDGGAIDWERWLKPSDVSRIIPADEIFAKGKEQLLLGVGISQGLTFPWKKTDGNVLIKPGKVAIWTGWSHHGKTNMLKQLMLWAVKSGEKVLICSMEEEILEVWRDMAVMYSQTDKPSPGALDFFGDFISNKVWFYDQQGTVDAKRMQALLRYAHEKLGTTQVMIDSLMMLAVDRDDYEAQSRFVGELKSIGKDTHQTIHLVAHMRKRTGSTGDDQPGSQHDIAGGHEIASKADYVFSVWRDKKPKVGADDCILTVEKQRGRPNWLGRIGLKYHPSSRQFIEGRYPVDFD